MLILNGLDYSYQDGVFCNISSLNTKGLDYSYQRGPFVILNLPRVGSVKDIAGEQNGTPNGAPTYAGSFLKKKTMTIWQ